MDRNGHTGSNGSRRIKIPEGMDSQIIPQLSPQWPQTFAKSMDIYSHSPSSGRINGVGSSSFQNESLFSSFEHLPEANGMENSNTGLKEPLLIQRKRHPQEEYEENEYWGDHAIGIVEHANNEKTDEGSTFLRASLNGMNVLAGVGILSTPYALSEGGWLGLSILFLFSAICCYTGILLKRCMETNTQIRSYPDIGQAAFGQKGRIIVSIFLYVELYAVTVEFLILEGDNLAQLFPKVALEFAGIRINSQQSFILLSAFVILPTVYLRNLSLLAYISASGVAASVLVVLAVGWVGVFDGVGFHLQGRLLNLGGLSTAIGLYAFCFCGHAVFPSIYSSMKDRKQFSMVLILCFVVCTMIYGSIAVMGYMMFGNQLESQVTLNLPETLVASKVAIYITLINPFAKFSLTITPLATALEEFLPSSGGWLVVWGTGIRTLLVISTVAVALAVPFFGYLMALIGSLLSCSVSIIIPCICYLKLFGASMSRHEMTLIYIIVILGIVTAITGTYSSLRNIADAM
uniref:BEBT1 n=1 Tax=Pinus tabuliformis TaxID=88731 RepID=A0A0K0M6X2_PINTB|nr:BEBT1 [Pinus tabuliformis]